LDNPQQTTLFIECSGESEEWIINETAQSFRTKYEAAQERGE
jgi:hypothetical protein